MVVTLVSVGFEEISPAIRQDNGAVVGTERARPDQTLVSEMSNTSPRIVGIVAPVLQIALGHNPKGADGREHAALGAVELVDTTALPNGSAFASTWELEVSREHVTGGAWLIPIAIARAAAATQVAVPGIAPIALAVPRIAPVPHVSIVSTSC